MYNPENIERVRRDEAQAQAEALEEERSRQHEESGRRLALLRSEQPGVTSEQLTSASHQKVAVEPGNKHRRPNDNSLSTYTTPDRSVRQPLGDTGFPNTLDDPTELGSDRPRRGGNATRSDRTTNKELDNLGIRLTDAAGFGANANQPWYNTAPTEGKYPSVGTGKDVWGNEDPRRKEREQQRMNSNDPLAAIKRGVKQIRKAEADRNEWKVQRERDLNEVEELSKKEHERHRHRRRRHSDADSLEGFDLDAGYRKKAPEREEGSSDQRRRRHRHDHSHRHRHRREPSTSRDRRRSRSPNRRHK